MRRMILLGLALLLMAGYAVLASQGPQTQMVQVERNTAVPGFIGYVPDEIVVNFERSTAMNMDQATALQGRTGLSEVDRIGRKYGSVSVRAQFPGAMPKMAKGTVVDLSGWHKVRFSGQVDVEQAVRDYRALPGVIDAQPIGIHTTSAVPNDGYFSYQWHLNRANDHDVDAPEAWDIETGDASVILAILDTGVRYYHKDLGGANASPANPGAARGNMWINTTELNGSSGVDDDGNGYTDDWVGYDFVDGATQCWTGEDCTTKDNDPRDFNGHGTHCSGIVTALANDGYGMCGIAGGWHSGTQPVTGNGVKVMACRIGWSGKYLTYEVGYVRMDFAAEAFYYAANNGARIASCSWGASNSGGIDAAINYFLADGGLIFKAAGNDGSQTADYMCARTDIISVAATDTNDCKADFSTYGTWVDISAPGTTIWSTYHDHTDATPDYWAGMDGTSMATPAAAGTGALIWSANPGWTASQVQTKLFDSADDIDALACNTSYAGKLGAGRINAYNGVYGGGPSAPVANFSGTPTSGCIPFTVTFSDLSTGEITSWAWTFGDGGTSTAQNPSHQYTTAGTYSVSLTVTGPGGSDAETKTNYITARTVPVANFSGTPTSGSAPLTVMFTDLSTGSPTAWSWTFGDGGTATTQNPTHQYTAAGTYTVTLTASNTCGSDGETKTGYITVTQPSQYCDDFNDGSITDWLNKLGTWTATGGYMKGNSATTDARTTSPFGTFGAATINADVRMNTGRTQRNARLIFGYADASNYRFIVGDDLNNRWQICDRVSGKNTVRATYSRTVNTAQWYDVIVAAASDGNVTLTVDGTVLGSYKFSAVKSGLVGCGFTKSNSDFDNFCVQASAGKLVDEPVVTVVLPETFILGQNYPNPFNPETNIDYALPVEGLVRMDVYNMLGQLVTTLVDEYQPAGTYSVSWDASGMPTGVYFYRINAGQFTAVKKMVLMK